MRLVTVRTKDGTRAGRLDGETIELLPFPDVGALLTQTDWGAVVEQNRGEEIAAADADLAPVVPAPSKIICLGLNYRDHAAESGSPIPRDPVLFSKYATSLVGHGANIVNSQSEWYVPLNTTDWSPVIAKIQAAKPDLVYSNIFAASQIGFIQKAQQTDPQFFQKTFEKSTPVGPAVVTLDELPGGIEADLPISCEVDGEQMQKARTSDLLFPPAVLVEYISTIMTLEPGDIVATGTPNGVGAGRNPPVFLKPGQTVRTTIEGVGELVNPTVAEAV